MNHLQSYDACVVCGSRRAYVLATREELADQNRYRDQLFKQALPGTPDYLLDDLTIFTNSYDARLVVCKNCGLVCRDPRFDRQGTLQAYAQDDYASEWLEQTFEKYYHAFRSNMPELGKRIGRAATVLEIGSYVGGFLAAARDYGWHAQGIDVGRRVSEFTRGKGLDVFQGTLAQANLAPGFFDAVFIWVCFDQLPDPWTELKEIRRVLKKGGSLVLVVPNGDFIKLFQRVTYLFRSLAVRDQVWKLLTYTGLAGFPYQIGYTPATLRRILNASGFGKIEIRNAMNISDSAGSNSLTRMPEQRRYVLGVYWMVQAMQWVSLHRLVPSPWIRVSCQGN
jgi:SAM-dependent methyltransferase